MFAVVKTGGKQYKVAAGDVIRVERLEGDVGSDVSLDEVLLLGGDSLKVGNPTVAGAKVTAEITAQAKAKKVIVFKKQRRKATRKKNGHRQFYTELKIKSIA